MDGRVIAVSRSETHTFSKPTRDRILLIAGHGIEGDAHAGATVKHRSRVAKEGHTPNLRQVHFMHSELFEELRLKGFVVKPGEMGENVTTQGIDILGLPQGALLHLGNSAVVEITGLRNPCGQIDDFQMGLKEAVLDRDADGNLIRKSGVMGVVVVGGEVCPGDPITVELPAEPHKPLERV